MASQTATAAVQTQAPIPAGTRPPATTASAADRHAYVGGQPVAKETFERRLFYAGQVIFREGDAGREAFVVQSGAVEILRADTAGLERVLAVVKERALFGEMALIDARPRSASARAVQDTVCFVIREHDFKERMRDASPWIRAMMRILANNVRSANTTIETLSQQVAAFQKTQSA